MWNKLVLPVLAITLGLGCATQNVAVRPAIPTALTFNAPKSAVWPLLISEVALKYPVKAVEKDSGLLTTDFVSMPAGFGNMHMDRWVFPPRSFLPVWNGLRMNLTALATEPEPGKTRLLIRTHYEAFESNVLKSWIVCESNNSLENEILTQIAQLLSSTASPGIPVAAVAKPPEPPLYRRIP